MSRAVRSSWLIGKSLRRAWKPYGGAVVVDGLVSAIDRKDRERLTFTKRRTKHCEINSLKVRIPGKHSIDCVFDCWKFSPLVLFAFVSLDNQDHCGSVSCEGIAPLQELPKEGLRFSLKFSVGLCCLGVVLCCTKLCKEWIGLGSLCQVEY